MQDAAPLHPQMQTIAAAMRAGPPISGMTPAQARESMAGLEAMLGTGPAIARAETLRMAGPGGHITLRLLAPADPQGVILYFHGGGWVLGTIGHVEAAGRILADASGCAVVLVDYRLAPEAPCPAAIEDSRAALIWAQDNMVALLGKDLPVVVAGDSAGGNLAALLAAWSIDQDRCPVAAQFLAYPVTGADFDTESYRTFADGPILDRKTMAWFWDHYLPDITARNDPSILPLARDNFAGLPPAIFVSAGHDPLLSEGDAYAAALRDAGVPVVSRHFTDMAHGFVTMPTVIDAGADALAFAGGEIARMIGRNAPKNVEKI